MRSRPSQRVEPDDEADRIGLTLAPALATVLAGAGLLLTGLAIGATPLLVPGVAFALLGIICPLWTLAVAWGVGAGGRRLDTTVIEGRTLEWEVEITGRRILGLTSAQLQHPLLSEALTLDRVVTASGTVVISVRAPRRGRLRLPAPTLLVTDPLGLSRLRRRAGPGGEVLVLPRIDEVRWIDAGVVMIDAARALLGSEGVDVDGLRPYRPGTPATRIHWAALANGTGLLERVPANEINAVPLIAIDPRTVTGASGEAELDAVIRAVASLTLELAKHGGVDLLLPARAQPLRVDSSLGTWPAAHAALALLPGAAPVAPGPRFPAQRRAVVIYACTGTGAVTQASRRYGDRLIRLAPGRCGADRRAVLSVAGCVGDLLPGGRRADRASTSDTGAGDVD